MCRNLNAKHVYNQRQTNDKLMGPNEVVGCLRAQAVYTRSLTCAQCLLSLLVGAGTLGGAYFVGERSYDLITLDDLLLHL